MNMMNEICKNTLDDIIGALISMLLIKNTKKKNDKLNLYTVVYPSKKKHEVYEPFHADSVLKRYISC